MAEISLRAYLDYIEDRMARDAYSEVIAQCRHILETYPKHIETYKLLARALAAQEDRQQDALDLFQRVLSADPNDFIAHVGMSDAYRESGALDQAIWHLERAFEQAPNNRELQDEIKRLYQQRGGKVPRKIHLTSGALARMYARGKLHDQAIAEIRAGIARDPERLDLQVLLAQVLWDSHQQVEAGRVAAAVLKRLPYSIDANRILAQLWLEAGSPTEAQPFLERVKELDPIQGYALEHGGQSPPADAFRLTMLDYSLERQATQTGAADWVSQISAIEKQRGVTGPFQTPSRPSSITDIFLRPSEGEVSLPTGVSAEEMPEWLQSALGPAIAPSGAESGLTQAALPPQPLPTSDEPSWLQEALSSTADLPPAEPSFAAPDRGEVPDWLRDTLTGSAEPVVPTAPTAATDQAPAWLQGVLSSTPAPAETGDMVGEAPSGPTTPEHLPSPIDGTPDWLREIRDSEGIPPAAADVAAPGGEERDVPDWLSDILSEPAAGGPGAAGASETPAVVSDEWLDDFLVEGPPISARPTTQEAPMFPPPAGSTPAASELAVPAGEAAQRGPSDLETWDGTPPISEGWPAQATAPEFSPEAEAAKEEPALPEWLLTDRPLAVEPAAITSQGEEEPLPDWLTGAPSPTESREEIGMGSERELPDWLREGQPAEPERPPALEEVREAELMPDWLAELGTPASAEEPSEPALASDEAVPDWLHVGEEPQLVAGLPLGETQQPVAISSVPITEEGTPVAATEEPKGDEGSKDIPDWMIEGDLDSEDAVAWLEQIAAKYDPGFKGEETPAEPAPAAESATVPVGAEPEKDEEISWLREPLESPIAEAKPEEPGEEEAMPAWLKMEEEQPEGPAPAVAPAGVEETLAWLDRQVEAQGVSPSGVISEELVPDHPPVATPPPPPPDAEAIPASEDELPDWLRGEEIQAEIERALEHPIADREMADLPDLEVEDEELAWLDETLKAEEGVSADLEDLLAEREKEEEGLPSWLAGEEEKPTLAPAMVAGEGEEAQEELPAWLHVEEEAVTMPGPSAEAKEQEEPEEKEEELPTWLKAEEGAEGAPAAPALAEEEELPAWLRTEEQAPTVLPEEGKEAGELPAWLREEEGRPVPVAPPPSAPAPIVEPAPGEPLPAWLEAPAEPVDAGLDAFLKTAVPAAPVAEQPTAPPPSPPTVPPAPTPVPSAAPAGEELATARQQMAAGQIGAALNTYEGLVAKGHSLDDVRSDLSEYVKQGRNIDPRAYRIIGDVLMAQHNLQEALEMYRRALDQF